MDGRMDGMYSNNRLLSSVTLQSVKSALTVSRWLLKLMSKLCFSSLDADKKIRFEDVLEILSKAGRPYDRTYAQELFKVFTLDH